MRGRYLLLAIGNWETVRELSWKVLLTRVIGLPFWKNSEAPEKKSVCRKKRMEKESQKEERLKMGSEVEGEAAQ